MFVIDTNVLSAMMSPERAPMVAAWMAKWPIETLFTVAVCQAEILAGLAILPSGRRRSKLEAAAVAVFAEDFADRVLPFDADAASAYASIYAVRRQTGRPIAVIDLMVAAVAYVHGASVVTRDIGGFEGCGVALINPWVKT